MKNFYRFLVGLLVAVGLGSCSGNEEEVSSVETYQLNFQVTNYEQISLNGNSRTRAANDDPYLAMVVYDAQTNKLVGKPVIHDPGAAGAGEFSARLPKGDYNIVFLAYPTKKALIPEDPTAIQWENQVVVITHLKKIDISVDEDTNSQQEIILSRAVGMFTLKSKGTAVPENFDHFRIQMTGGSYQLNALTGFAGSDVTRDYAFSSPKNVVGKTEITQSGLAFLPQEECKVDITLIAEDADNKPIRRRTFTQVPMKINQETRYTGDFFSEASTSGFSVKIEEQEWETVDVEF